ncbi:hypothetical protein [Caballeronia telluris]|uniref:Uncharacterized protein n=1 Tax=Caballeronia telluris TaxID=326475 RepID=A0A158H4Y7_9BURK|nr:hypothetical protein [Caballeronia telluris]SAL38810.1 hypothetical protein AWB66_01995 [Caballeronia telluris]
MASIDSRIISNVFIAFFAFVSQFAVANTLIEFDTPYIVAEEKDGKINGYYGLTLPGVESIRPPVSCRFFFTSASKPEHSSQLTVQTFSTDSTYKNRDPAEDLPGELVIAGERWTIQMERLPDGCLTAAGGGFQKGSAVPNSVEKRTPIVGLLVIRGKSNFFDYKNGGFSKRNGFLVRGDVVVALDKRNDFYFVKFLNDTSGRTSTGWVKISDTVTPFPE